jgi:hypothetical protein
LFLAGGTAARAGTAPADLPAADAQTTVEKLNLGPTRLYAHWTGKARAFRIFLRNVKGPP